MASSRPVFRFYVDWLNDGDFIDTNDEVTSISGGNALAADGLTIAYGRDQARAFSPVRAGEAAFKLNNASRMYCVEVDTEALAYGRGWVTHDQLQPGDRILAFDPADDAIRWEAVESVSRFTVDGQMIRWQSTRSIDVLTTPNHRWWTVGTSGTVEYAPRFRSTQEISGHQLYVKIGGGVPQCFAAEATFSDDFVELLGWVFTEGWYEEGESLAKRLCAKCGVVPARGVSGPPVCDGCAKYPLVQVRPRPLRDGPYTRTGFGQSQTANPKNVTRIRELIQRLVACGHPVTEHQYRSGKSIMSTWRFAGELDRQVREALPGKGLTAGLLCKLTHEQAELLLDTLILADGTVTPSGLRYFIQKSRSQLDLVAMLCAMLGVRTSLRALPNSSGVSTLSLCSGNRLIGTGVNARPEHYEGTVWCPRIRTGIFLARCRGRTFWTGNSPENSSSPLFGQLVPGRPVKITATQDAATTTIYRGFLDDYTVSPNRGDRTVTLSCLDLMARFAQANPLSTPLYAGIRTGTAIGYILDALGWPGGARDLDPGASTIRWWWEEGTDGLTALARMLAAEGPPAICFVDTNANFVYRDRHHRLLDAASTAVQATFTNGTSTETATTVTFSQPMTYDTGWRDIVNTIIVPVDQRNQAELGVVWQTDATIAVPAGTSVSVIAQSGDPFLNAVTPVADTDYTLLTGTATAALSRTSGQAVTIALTDSGSGSIVTGLQLRANPVTVARTVQVSVTDTASQAAYGVRGLPSGIDISGATVEDVVAVATTYVTRYAQRKPIVTIPVANANDKRLTQQLARDLSDRVHITDTETGLNADFFIEQISHATTGTGRVLTTTFGCEKADATSPANVFTFDDATNGKFNTGKFGT